MAAGRLGSVVVGTVFFENMVDAMSECLNERLAVALEGHVADFEVSGLCQFVERHAVVFKVFLFGDVSPYHGTGRDIDGFLGIDDGVRHHDGIAPNVDLVFSVPCRKELKPMKIFFSAMVWTTLPRVP